MNPNHETALRTIAFANGLSLEQLRGRTRAREACEARRNCYRYLRRKSWSVDSIAEYFLRHPRVVWAAIASDEVRARNKAWHHDYWRKTSGRAA